MSTREQEAAPKTYLNPTGKKWSHGLEIAEMENEISTLRAELAAAREALDLETKRLDREASVMLASLEKLEKENAALLAALQRIHEGACRTAVDSRSRDDDRYCLAEVIRISGEAIK